MPSLTIELKLRSSSTKELTFEEVDGNFVNLKNAIISVNDTLNDQDTKFSGISHDHGMSGMVAHFARKTAPIGWLVCDGAAVSRTTYANLFAAIGVVFGVGDGVNTFNLPDLRGEFIRGWDKGRGVDAGREFGSFQTEEIKEHRHGFGGQQGWTGGGNNAGDTIPHSSRGYNFTTDPSGGAETRPRNVALLPCIKF